MGLKSNPLDLSYLNQGLVVALDFRSVLDRACFFMLIFWFLGACFV